MDKNQNVSLGCGTLILIALIVLIFGRGPSEKEMEELRQELRGLRTDVSAQSQEIRALTDLVSKRLPAAADEDASE